MEKDEMWRQRDGTLIAVGDMDEAHVRNTLRMILRQTRQRRERAAYEENLLAEEMWRSEKDW